LTRARPQPFGLVLLRPTELSIAIVTNAGWNAVDAMVSLPPPAVASRVQRGLVSDLWLARRRATALSDGRMSKDAAKK
jgi:hypothetical protein